MGSSSSAISTLAEFNARLGTLQQAADSSGQPGRIPMGQIFQLAKDFVSASLEDIEALLDSPSTRDVAAVSIMDFQARRQATPDGGRRALYELYLRRHDRIDTWDLVDRAAPHVVGGYLWDKSREPLYLLAGSPNWYDGGPRSSAPGSSSAAATWMTPIPDPVRFTERPPRPGAEGGRWLDREAGKRDDQRLRDYPSTFPQPCLLPRSTLCYRTAATRFVVITSAAGTTERLEPEPKFDRR